MTAHTYSLRSRVSSSSLSAKTPTQSPLPKSRSPRKGSSSSSALQLRHVIGTTSSTPGGLSCCPATNSYAYCAGSVAVLASIDPDDGVTFRYFKARPTATPVNQSTSYYDSPLTSNTPTRRKTLLGTAKWHEDHNWNPVGRDWADEASGQTWSARERIKAASCVAISTDGRILAVGEIGYNPRVLLFSTAATVASDSPLSIMTDHSVGVRNVAFSPDSKYLATLGDVNDGFLYIWSINTKSGVVRLLSSNKCTTNVCDMTWCGNSVVTVGTRHIKVWQAFTDETGSSKRKSRMRREGEFSNLSPLPLQGRNCLLGPLVDATFTTVVAISDDQAVVCTDNGHLCYLDLSMGKTELTTIKQAQERVSAISYRQNTDNLIWAADGGSLKDLNLSVLKTLNSSDTAVSNTDTLRKRRTMLRHSHLRQSLGLSSIKSVNTVALGCLNDKVICIDAEGAMRISKIDSFDFELDLSNVASHTGTVRGVQKLPREAGLGSFYTWARDGEVRFWDSAGLLIRSEAISVDDNVEVEDAAINELKVVRYARASKTFVAGDQFGVLKVIGDNSWETLQIVRAHSAEVNSIDIHTTSSIVATCSRDRTVQIFLLRSNEIELLQTCDDHISSVNQVLFSHNGNRLLSCSADRTVVVRERIERKLERETTFAYIAAKTITMKAAPLSMSFLPASADLLAISTMDRQVVKIDVATGTTISSFKVADRDSDDTVILNTICLGTTSTGSGDACLLAGYSAIDKSVRLYDLDKGVLLGRDSGHTEGISDISMFEDDSTEKQSSELSLVTTGLDSTIMIWSTMTSGRSALTPQQELSQAQAFRCDPEKKGDKMSPAMLPPLRKILTKIDLADFVRQNSPTRESSPGGLRRKTSRLALTTSIEEADETPASETSENNRSRSRETRVQSENRSPSPASQMVVRPKKQRSRSEMTKGMDTRMNSSRRSPSPPASSMIGPSGTRHSTRANNSRLRRPPSVPNDLNAHAVVQGRRQSLNLGNDFGTIGMATEQACRMLRTYGKKLQASKGSIDLNEIEADLEAVLRAVKSKKARMNSMTENVEDEMKGLSLLLERTSVS